MSAADYLTEISRQLKEQFSSHSVIAVTPIQGNPPDRYEIAYNINGLSKTGKGDIVELAAHSIELTIPFGFPHFPPSCKPKSDTYHPDFDPAAICLGDFWSQDSQLAELIIHIGQMINGEIYSSTNAFNEEASAWYNSHPDIFPLAEIDWLGEKSERKVPGNIDNPAIDTLDASDLSTDFDFLALDNAKAEEGQPLESGIAPGNPPSSVDLSFLQLLENQRKFFEIREILKDADNASEELHQLAIRTEESIGEAAGLHREAKKLEKRGEKKEALAAYEQVVLIVSDFPEIETHLNRLRQTLIPRDLPPETDSASFVGELVPDDKSSVEPVKIPSPEKKREIKPQGRKHLPRTSWPLKKQLACVLGGIIAVALAGCGYYYLIVTNKVGSAEDAFSRCLAAVNNGQFEEAKQSCEQALTAGRNVKVFHQQRIAQLSTDINQIMQSERFIQGLTGNTLVDGMYLPHKDAETIRTFHRLHKEADDFFLQENWQQANDRFGKILDMAKLATSLPADIVADIRTKRGIAEFRMIFATAEHALQNGKWLEAISTSDKAESLLSALPDDDRQQYANSLRKMIAKGSFENHREKGDAFFAESDWQDAIATYQLALSTLDAADAVPEHSFEAVRSNIKRAELYLLIDQGNKAFGSGVWDEAIDSYRRAETFLGNLQGHQNADDTEPNRQKLSRVILQARIVRDRQLAARHLENNDMLAAVKTYRQLIEDIKNSSFSEESEFRKTNNEIAATIATLDEQIYLADKAQYLKDEYRTIFIANYPTAIPENLVNPTITFAKDSGDKLIFKMQCTETGERPLTLILYYAFDKKSGRWDQFTDQL